ncbi:DUF202 domain-containing protein [Cellulomonas triticagri]|uniref:DUF202 domain-containing protein n=1 Tax=Cellulomonas triticagri TaxID=2483352 RepID=UPI001F3405AA|nr:DUF202 domain-containing protein [Cellulomonas triticagri]
MTATPSAPHPVPPPGAQPERTALAWRRTALSVAVGALLAARVLEPWAGPAVWLLALAGLGAAVGLGVTGARRARRWAEVVDDARPEVGPGSGTPTTPGGAPLAVTAVAVALLGVAALLAVLLHPPV